MKDDYGTTLCDHAFVFENHCCMWLKLAPLAAAHAGRPGRALTTPSATTHSSSRGERWEQTRHYPLHPYSACTHLPCVGTLHPPPIEHVKGTRMWHHRRLLPAASASQHITSQHITAQHIASCHPWSPTSHPSPVTTPQPPFLPSRLPPPAPALAPAACPPCCAWRLTATSWGGCAPSSRAQQTRSKPQPSPLPSPPRTPDHP